MPQSAVKMVNPDGQGDKCCALSFMHTFPWNVSWPEASSWEA